MFYHIGWFWRALLVGIVVLFAVTFVLLERTLYSLQAARAANVALAEAVVSGNAEVDAALHIPTGTVLVRVNGQHIHAFPGMCPPQSRL